MFVKGSQIQIGKTYAFTGWPESMTGRKALIVRRLGESLYYGRWPSGEESLVRAAYLRGPVEPAVPGVDEKCLICFGKRTIAIYERDPERSWISYAVGEKPCPHCAAGRSGRLP